MGQTAFRVCVIAVSGLVLAACGASSESSGGARGEVGGNDALRWGDGGYGVVLAHGAAFDAASWSDQATQIAEQGATVVAVAVISPDAIAGAVEARCRTRASRRSH